MFKLTVLVTLLVVFGFAAQARAEENKLQHVVSFKFKEDVKPEKIEEVVNALKALKGKISEIKAMEAGVNNSPENLNKGFTHCFIITFDSEKGRDTYLKHKDHEEFVQLVKPVLADVFVVDFWTNPKK
jgi:hypothetical protein